MTRRAHLPKGAYLGCFNTFKDAPVPVDIKVALSVGSRAQRRLIERLARRQKRGRNA